MARVEITFHSVGNRSREGGTMPVARAAGMVTEVLEVDAAGAATATQADGEGTTFARVWAAADVWVAAGETPSAAAPGPGGIAPGWRVPAGTSVDLALERGDRVAAAEIG